MPNKSGWFKSTKKFLRNYFPPFSGIASAAMIGLKLIIDLFNIPKKEKTEFDLTLSTGVLDLFGAIAILSLMWSDDVLDKNLHFSNAHIVRKYLGATLCVVTPLLSLGKFGFDFFSFLSDPSREDNGEPISRSSLLFWKIALTSGGFLIFSAGNALVSFTLYYWPESEERNLAERSYKFLGINLKTKSNWLKRDKYGFAIAESTTMSTGTKFAVDTEILPHNSSQYYFTWATALTHIFNASYIFTLFASFDDSDDEEQQPLLPASESSALSLQKRLFYQSHPEHLRALELIDRWEMALDLVGLSNFIIGDIASLLGTHKMTIEDFLFNPNYPSPEYNISWKTYCNLNATDQEKIQSAPDAIYNYQLYQSFVSFVSWKFIANNAIPVTLLIGYGVSKFLFLIKRWQHHYLSHLTGATFWQRYLRRPFEILFCDNLHGFSITKLVSNVIGTALLYFLSDSFNYNPLPALYGALDSGLTCPSTSGASDADIQHYGCAFAILKHVIDMVAASDITHESYKLCACLIGSSGLLSFLGYKFLSSFSSAVRNQPSNNESIAIRPGPPSRNGAERSLGAISNMEEGMIASPLAQDDRAHAAAGVGRQNPRFFTKTRNRKEPPETLKVKPKLSNRFS